MSEETQAAPVTVTASTEPSVSAQAPAAESTPAISNVIPSEALPGESPAEAPALLAAEPKIDGKAEDNSPDIKESAEKPLEDKPAEGEKKPEDKKTEEAKKDEKPAEEAVPVTYEPFKLPDSYKDNTDAVETVGKFSDILGKLEGSKREHGDFQKFGQEATDFYINGVNGALAKQQDYYVNLHQKNITDRIDAVRKDPQLGGKNFEKTSADMIAAVQSYGGNKEQVLQLRKSMQESGMGVEPSLVRLVANMKSALDKYTKEPISNNLTGTKPDVQKRGTISTLYGS
jgi:hypothetical protein